MYAIIFLYSKIFKRTQIYTIFRDERLYSRATEVLKTLLPEPLHPKGQIHHESLPAMTLPLCNPSHMITSPPLDPHVKLFLRTILLTLHKIYD